MKFSDGYWMTREGYEVISPYEVHDVKVGADGITVYATNRHLETRGNTLNAPLITMEFSSPMKDIIRAKFYHHKGTKRLGPDSFPLLTADRVPVEIENTAQFVSLKSGDAAVTITKAHPISITYTYKGRKLTRSGSRSTGYVKAADGHHHFREQLDLGIGESVYGLGERFTPFVKNGQSVDIWNEDGGTLQRAGVQEHAVLPHQPRLRRVRQSSRASVASRSRPRRSRRCSSACRARSWNTSSSAADRRRTCWTNYTALTGRPALPPAWSFGLWLTHVVHDELRRGDRQRASSTAWPSRDIPLHVFHFDCFWMKERHWCDFEWDSDVFPDPRGHAASV